MSETRMEESRKRQAGRLATSLGLDGDELYRGAVAAWSNLNPQTASFDQALSVAAAVLGALGAAQDALRPRYPEVKVRLTGKSSNSIVAIGSVSAALRRAGVGEDELAEFAHEAMSGGYDDMLATCMRWVSVS